MLVRRLIETKSGPYTAETKEVTGPVSADRHALKWNNDPITKTVIVLSDAGKIEARFTPHGMLDGARVPSNWKSLVGPTISKRKPDGNRPEASVVPSVISETDEHGAKPPLVVPISQCACCMGARDHGSPERDKSPSGRLADGRCPACGRQLRMPNRQLWDMYRDFQKRENQR